MRNTKATIRRFLPVMIGAVMLTAASSAFAQATPSGPLQGLLNQYQSVALGWVSTLINYATDLFVALASIEFAWTAVVLVMEQRELEGWVAAFLKKLMGISFFYVLLLKGPDWIPTIINSFTTIGTYTANLNQQSAQPTGPDQVLGLGVKLAGDILAAAGGLANPGFLGLGLANVVQNLPWILLLGAIAVVVVLCYVAITLQFIMAQVEGFIVVSAGMIYLGFGGSRWTSSYTERFLGTAVTTGIRIMVTFLIIGMGVTLNNAFWKPSAQNVVNDINSGTLAGYGQATSEGFSLAASVIIFTVLAFRLPKVVGSVISGSPSLSGGDLAGTVGTLIGGAEKVAETAATVAGTAAMLAVAPEAAPEMLAARGGATAARAGAEGAMSAGKAADAGAGSLKGMSGGGPMDFAGKAGSSEAKPPASSPNKNAPNGSGAPGSNAANQTQPPGSSNKSASNASGTPGSNASRQSQPPTGSASGASSSASLPPSRSAVGSGANAGGGGVNRSGVGTQASTSSPSIGSTPGSMGSPTPAGEAAPPSTPSAGYDSGFSFSASQQQMGAPASGPPPGQPQSSPQNLTQKAQDLAQGAQNVAHGASNIAHQVLHSLENDGGGDPVSVPPPTEGSLRGD